MAERINRRGFLRGAGAAGAAVVAAPYFVPSRAFGANERPVLGIIGPGGRGRSLMNEFRGHGCEFGAICDVYKPNREAAMEIAKKSGREVKEYADWRQLLDKEKGLDALVIATPEHQHAMQLISATRAGFDVYCEKPMSHSIEEGNRIVREVNKTDRVVQIGMQRRSSPIVRKGKQVIDSKILGDVRFVRVKWNWDWNPTAGIKDRKFSMSDLDWKAFCEPSGKVKFDPLKYFCWRFFWKFSGGNICDQGTHLMDVVQWYMGEEFNPVLPRSAECFGDVYRMEGVETPDVFTSIFNYDKFLVNWSLDYATTYQNDWSIEFMGDKGAMALDHKGMAIYDAPWDPEETTNLRSKKKPVVQELGALGSVEHTRNFLDCVKSRNRKTNAPVEIGHLAVCGPHLANVAYHAKERAYLSPDARKTDTKGWWIFK